MLRKGFTLIELLVVIAIVAILAAILFPVFAQAKASAKKTACLANTRQIGIALYLYLQDSDEVLPIANYSWPCTGDPSSFSFLGGGHPVPCWADLVQPYAVSFKLFKCPDDFSGPFIDTTTNTPVPGEPLSYALNYYFYRRLDGFHGAEDGGNLGLIANPSAKLFVVESASNLSREIVNPATNRSAGLYRHLNGSNYIYADTHAKYHRSPKDWKNYTSSQWGNPAFAQTLGYDQWFPWIDGGEKW